MTAMQEEVRSHRQAGLKVLVRLQGQGAGEQPLGPWALDMEQKSMKEVICHNMQPSRAVSRLCTQLKTHAADIVQLASYMRDICQQAIGENSCSSHALRELHPLTDG